MQRLLVALVLIMTSMPAMAEKRVALVIGNSNYIHANPLPNTLNDAADMSAKLAALGFQVTTGKDLSLEALRLKVREFIRQLDGADIAMLFYAGHGLQVNGTNYMVPIDAALATEDDVGFEALPMESVLTPMERASKVNLIFLDACRDNPLARNLSRSMGTRSASVGQGLARIGSGVGTLIAFSTQPGNVALDGSGRNSPFATAILKYLGTPGQDITRDLVMARRDVIAATGGKQVPWDNSSLTGDVILMPAPEAAATPDSSVELVMWDSIKNESAASFFEKYLERFPAGQFAELARLKIANSPKAVDRTTAPVPPTSKNVGDADFDKSKLARLDPELPGSPGTPAPSLADPKAMEAALGMAPDDLQKVRLAMSTLGYQTGKDANSLEDIDRKSLRKLQIKHSVRETGYLDVKTLNRLLKIMEEMPRTYEGKWNLDFHRYHYRKSDPVGVNLRTRMATAMVELRDGELYIINSHVFTSQRNYFETFSGKLAPDGKFKMSMLMDSAFDDEPSKRQEIQIDVSNMLPKYVTYNQTLEFKGSQIWTNKKTGENVWLKLEITRVK